MWNINKEILIQVETMARALQELAPDDKFGGCTLAEFKDLVDRIKA
jgi:hypothetical protein